MSTSTNHSTINKDGMDNSIYTHENYADFELPTEIDLTNILEQKVSIKSKTKLKLGEFIGIDIPIMGDVCSVVGKVENIVLIDGGWQITLELEYVPVEVVSELEAYNPNTI